MAARSAKGRAQRLSKDLTCSICLDLFKKPVSLPCDHTFCRACIAGFWSRPPRLGQDQVQDQGQNPNSNQCGVTVASCPQCREVFPSQSCRPNRIVASIVESYCQGLEEGESLGTGRAAAEAMPQCARHQEDLKLFCEDDQELVCLVCGVSQEHKSHTLVCIQEAQQRCKTTLSNSISALRTELSTALECEREIEEEVKKLKPQLLLSFPQPLCAKPNKEIGALFRNSLQAVLPSSGGTIVMEHTADLKQRIEAQFSDLHQFLYQEEKMLQVKLKTEERRELIRLDEHRAVLNVEISQLRRSLAEIEDRLKERDPYQLLKNAKALLQSRQPVKFERPPLTPPNLCEGRFAGPLQYRVWKSLKGILYPAPAAITFNSSTANPWLSLSPSLTCVRYQTFHAGMQDNPQRFNAALSLLGSQGFTHGRHYWEIEVYSSTVWTVGVARESVPRKGVIKALPSNGFWTISLSYGVQYMAGTSPPTVLSLEEPLSRIGVYLDFKRGLVSFYNAESMAHLYTFHETFTETLFPYFNLGFLDKVHENEPLKVFLPKV